MRLPEKEQAIEIYNEFYSATNDVTDVFKVKSKSRALKCSLICVDVIMKNSPKKDLKYWDDVKTQLYNID